MAVLGDVGETAVGAIGAIVAIGAGEDFSGCISASIVEGEMIGDNLLWRCC